MPPKRPSKPAAPAYASAAPKAPPAAPKAPPAAGRPAGIKTWVRIRPLASEGEKGGHAEGETVAKQLGAFDEHAVQIVSHDQGGKVASYGYPSRVFPVDCTQEDVGGELLPGLLSDFWGDRNVMIFAYGQTGTGKTTTMFGFPESLASETPHDGWGLLPRAVHATLARNAEQAARGVCSVLLLSAVEFYAYLAYDLADEAGKQMCTMNKHQVLGNTYMRCDTPSILREFIARVYGNRKVVATRMNEGSSRSHCAIILTLLQLETASQTFRQTQFSIVDLAGAERPEKALGYRISKEDAMRELIVYYRRLDGELTPGLQGYLINFELTNLLTEVVSATMSHKAGRKYTPGYGQNGGAAQFFGGALAGESRLGALICLSQSPQHGWETWYSIAQYGRQLAELKTRVRPVAKMPMAEALAQAEAAAAAATVALESAGESTSQMKFRPFKYGMVVYTEQRLAFLRVLNDMGGGGGSGSGGGKAAGKDGELELPVI